MATCLSVTGPCKEICEVCRNSSDSHYENEVKAAVEKSIRILRQHAPEMLNNLGKEMNNGNRNEN